MSAGGRSNDPRPHQIVDVERADDPVVRVDDEERGDPMALHRQQRLGRQGVGTHRLRMVGHHRRDRRRAQVDRAVDRAAQVAVGEHADRAIRTVDDRGHPETLARHLEQAVGERGLGRDARHVRAGPHHVRDPQQQPPAEIAGRMRSREVLLGESAGLQQRDRERIADRERGGRARGRREIQGAGFRRHTDLEVHRRGARQRRMRAAGQRDQRHAETLDHGNDREHLVGLAGVRQRQQHVVADDHPDVAVTRFRRVHEERGCAGAREGRGDLPGDVPGLAHPGDDHAATAIEADPARLRERGADPRQLGAQAVDFDRNRPSRGLDQLLVGEGWMHAAHDSAFPAGRGCTRPPLLL